MKLISLNFQMLLRVLNQQKEKRYRFPYQLKIHNAQWFMFIFVPTEEPHFSLCSRYWWPRIGNKLTGLIAISLGFWTCPKRMERCTTTFSILSIDNKCRLKTRTAIATIWYRRGVYFLSFSPIAWLCFKKLPYTTSEVDKNFIGGLPLLF